MSCLGSPGLCSSFPGRLPGQSRVHMITGGQVDRSLVRACVRLDIQILYQKAHGTTPSGEWGWAGSRKKSHFSLNIIGYNWCCLNCLPRAGFYFFQLKFFFFLMGLIIQG